MKNVLALLSLLLITSCSLQNHEKNSKQEQMIRADTTKENSYLSKELSKFNLNAVIDTFLVSKEDVIKIPFYLDKYKQEDIYGEYSFLSAHRESIFKNKNNLILRHQIGYQDILIHVDLKTQEITKKVNVQSLIKNFRKRAVSAKDKGIIEITEDFSAYYTSYDGKGGSISSEGVECFYQGNMGIGLLLKVGKYTEYYDWYVFDYNLNLIDTRKGLLYEGETEMENQIFFQPRFDKFYRKNKKYTLQGAWDILVISEEKIRRTDVFTDTLLSSPYNTLIDSKRRETSIIWRESKTDSLVVREVKKGIISLSSIFPYDGNIENGIVYLDSYIKGNSTEEYAIHLFDIANQTENIFLFNFKKMIDLQKKENLWVDQFHINGDGVWFLFGTYSENEHNKAIHYILWIDSSKEMKIWELEGLYWYN